MRNRFDHLGKQIGKQALGASGHTVVHDEIAPEAQYADLCHEPDPARAAERARLGLLGRIASSLCIIELYGHAPDGAELRACLSKHLAFWQRHARRTRAQKDRPPPPAAPAEPSLWIIAAGTPVTLLAELAAEPAPGWPPGVYRFGGAVLRANLVAVSELPRERSTLLVRLMAGGALLPNAIADLSVLPEDAPERVVADQILLRLRHALERKPRRTPQEEEFIVAIYGTWDDARRLGRQEGQQEGREQGYVEARSGALLTVLRMRGIPVSDAERERILAERDLDRLERWLERASVAASLAAVLDEPS
jgi:hypothetical protein